MKDYFGREINAGDLVAYVRSDALNPLNHGYVKSVSNTSVLISGVGRSKSQQYLCADGDVNDMVIVLPKSY